MTIHMWSTPLRVALGTCVLSLSMLNGPLSADDKQKPAAEGAQAEKQESDKPNPFAVPEGGPKEMEAFIEKLKRTRPTTPGRDAQKEHYTKLVAALFEATDRILASDKATAEQLSNAIATKLQGFQVARQLDLPDAAENRKAFLKSISESKRPAIAKIARVLQLEEKAGSVGQMTEKQRQALMNEVAAAVKDSGLTRQAFVLAYRLGQSLERNGDEKQAAAFYNQVATPFAKSENADFAENANRLQGLGRRLTLVGSKLDITGNLLDGSTFDWKSYQGKVVLVDFWATWCGPCLQEMPNVVKNYEKYHDKGFEVVGISLDSNRSALERFVKKEHVPWTIIFSDDKDHTGWEAPLAVRYGVMSIPSMMLVGKDGKVITLQARGEELGARLEKLLGEPKSADEKSNDK